MDERAYVVFDVESIGLHGEGFAVGAVAAYIRDSSPSGIRVTGEMYAACDTSAAKGKAEDRLWVMDNVHLEGATHFTTEGVRHAFWEFWVAHRTQEGALLAADVCWPVEAHFLDACLYDNPGERAEQAPYPLIDIASVCLAAGRDPIGDFPRPPGTEQVHNPLHDARASLVKLHHALMLIDGWRHGLERPSDAELIERGLMGKPA